MQARQLKQFFQQCIGMKKLPGDLILEPEVVLDIKSFGESHGVDVSMPGFYAGGALAAVVADQLQNNAELNLAGLHFLSADGVAGFKPLAGRLKKAQCPSIDLTDCGFGPGLLSLMADAFHEGLHNLHLGGNRLGGKDLSERELGGN